MRQWLAGLENLCQKSDIVDPTNEVEAMQFSVFDLLGP